MSVLSFVSELPEKPDSNLFYSGQESALNFSAFTKHSMMDEAGNWSDKSEQWLMLKALLKPWISCRPNLVVGNVRANQQKAVQ